jgi:small nuclear ribonucleoprotein
MDGRPLDVLEAALEGVVTVRLKDGDEYRGVLSGYDQHMNLVLGPPHRAVEDESEGDATAEPAAEEPTLVEDTTVIRGDNVVTIRP